MHIIEMLSTAINWKHCKDYVNILSFTSVNSYSVLRYYIFDPFYIILF